MVHSNCRLLLPLDLRSSPIGPQQLLPAAASLVSILISITAPHLSDRATPLLLRPCDVVQHRPSTMVDRTAAASVEIQLLTLDCLGHRIFSLL